jgi:ssDNA-binding Zn-finger/Zn-ribbon topoisomerase 1
MTEYTCDHCGGTFVQEWSDADALAEYEEAFSAEERAEDDEPPVRVCDDCYKLLMARRKQDNDD